MSDPFLDGALRQLESLAAKHPGTLEAHRAREISRRARFYRSRGLMLPRNRRYILADIRSTTRALQRLDDTS